MARKTKQLNIRIDEETDNRLVNLQKTFKTSKSEILEMMLRDYSDIANQKKSIEFIHSQQQVMSEIVNIVETTRKQIEKLSETVNQQSTIVAILHSRTKN